MPTLNFLYLLTVVNDRFLNFTQKSVRKNIMKLLYCVLCINMVAVCAAEKKDESAQIAQALAAFREGRMNAYINLKSALTKPGQEVLAGEVRKKIAILKK